MIKNIYKTKLAALLCAAVLVLSGCMGPVHPEKMPADTNLGRPALE